MICLTWQDLRKQVGIILRVSGPIHLICLYKTHKLEESKFKLDKTGKLVYIKKTVPNWENYLSVEHWNYEPDEKIVVEVVSNLPQAELFLNGKSLGAVKLADCPDNIMRWCVPFEAGELVAKASDNGKQYLAELKSASEAALSGC